MAAQSKMAIKTLFIFHLISRHFDLVALFYFFIASELQNIKKRENFILRLMCYNKIMNFFEKYYHSRNFKLFAKKFFESLIFTQCK
jgi:hypothetical protein